MLCHACYAEPDAVADCADCGGTGRATDAAVPAAVGRGRAGVVAVAARRAGSRDRTACVVGNRPVVSLAAPGGLGPANVGHLVVLRMADARAWTPPWRRGSTCSQGGGGGLTAGDRVLVRCSGGLNRSGSSWPQRVRLGRTPDEAMGLGAAARGLALTNPGFRRTCAPWPCQSSTAAPTARDELHPETPDTDGPPADYVAREHFCRFAPLGRPAMKTRAAILAGSRTIDWSVEDIDLTPPKRGEILVKLATSGLCHSDEHLVTGGAGLGQQVAAGRAVKQFPIIGGGREEKPGASGGRTRSLSRSATTSCGASSRRAGSARRARCDLPAPADLGAFLLSGLQRLYRHHAKDGRDLGIARWAGRSPTRSSRRRQLVKITRTIPLSGRPSSDCGVTTGWGTGGLRRQAA